MRRDIEFECDGPKLIGCATVTALKRWVQSSADYPNFRRSRNELGTPEIKKRISFHLPAFLFPDSILSVHDRAAIRMQHLPRHIGRVIRC